MGPTLPRLSTPAAQSPKSSPPALQTTKILRLQPEFRRAPLTFCSVKPLRSLRLWPLREVLHRFSLKNQTFVHLNKKEGANLAPSSL